MKKYILSVIAWLFVLNVQGQSAWNRTKNGGFLKLSETIIISDQFYNQNGDIVPITSTGVYITNVYGEYGLTEKFTAFLYFPFFFHNSRQEQQLNNGSTIPVDKLNSIGDTDIGLSYGLKQHGNFVINISLLLGLPFGNTSGGMTKLLQSGDGEFNQMLKVNAGYSFYPRPFYFSGGIGFNNRTNNFSDELHINAELGATLKNWVISIKIYNRSSLDNGSAEAAQSGIFSNNIEYLAYGPEVSYLFKEYWGLSGTFQGAANGRNILASPSYSIGAFYKF